MTPQEYAYVQEIIKAYNHVSNVAKDYLAFNHHCKEDNEKLSAKYDDLLARHKALKEKDKRLRQEFYQYRQRNPEAKMTTDYAQVVPATYTTAIGYADALAENPTKEVGKITSTIATASTWPKQVWHKSGEYGWISDESVQDNFSWKLAPESTVTIAYYDQDGNRINMEDIVPSDYIHLHSNIYRKKTEHDTQKSWDLAQGGS